MGTRLSFADVFLAEALTSYFEWLPNPLSERSRLRGLRSRVLEQDGIAFYLGSEQHYRKGDDDDSIAAAKVLRPARRIGPMLSASLSKHSGLHDRTPRNGHRWCGVRMMQV